MSKLVYLTYFDSLQNGKPEVTQRGWYMSTDGDTWFGPEKDRTTVDYLLSGYQPEEIKDIDNQLYGVMQISTHIKNWHKARN